MNKNSKFIFKITKLFGTYDYELDFSNEVNVIIGENGTGKSTILKIINSLSNGNYNTIRDIDFEKIVLKTDDKEITLIKDDFYPIKEFILPNFSTFLTYVLKKENIEVLTKEFLYEFIQAYYNSDLFNNYEKPIYIDLFYRFDSYPEKPSKGIIHTNKSFYEVYNSEFNEIYYYVQPSDDILDYRNIIRSNINKIYENNICYINLIEKEIKTIFNSPKKNKDIKENLENEKKSKVSNDSKQLHSIFYDSLNTLITKDVNDIFNKFDVNSDEFNRKFSKIYSLNPNYRYYIYNNFFAILNDFKENVYGVFQRNWICNISREELDSLQEVIELINKYQYHKFDVMMKDKTSNVIFQEECYRIDNDREMNVSSLIRQVLLVVIFENVDYIENTLKICNRNLEGTLSKYITNKTIFYSTLTNDILFLTKSNKFINFEDLSDGEKNIVSFFKDFSSKRIALFDEPERAMSIFWQEMLLDDIIDKAKSKVIIATHSTDLVKENHFKYIIPLTVDNYNE